MIYILVTEVDLDDNAITFRKFDIQFQPFQMKRWTLNSVWEKYNVEAAEFRRLLSGDHLHAEPQKASAWESIRI